MRVSIFFLSAALQKGARTAEIFLFRSTEELIFRQRCLGLVDARLVDHLGDTH